MLGLGTATQKIGEIQKFYWQYLTTSDKRWKKRFPWCEGTNILLYVLSDYLSWFFVSKVASRVLESNGFTHLSMCSLRRFWQFSPDIEYHTDTTLCWFIAKHPSNLKSFQRDWLQFEKKCLRTLSSTIRAVVHWSNWNFCLSREETPCPFLFKAKILNKIPNIWLWISYSCTLVFRCLLPYLFFSILLVILFRILRCTGTSRSKESQQLSMEIFSKNG